MHIYVCRLLSLWQVALAVDQPLITFSVRALINLSACVTQEKKARNPALFSPRRKRFYIPHHKENECKKAHQSPSFAGNMYKYTLFSCVEKEHLLQNILLFLHPLHCFLPAREISVCEKNTFKYKWNKSRNRHLFRMKQSKGNTL